MIQPFRCLLPFLILAVFCQSIVLSQESSPKIDFTQRWRKQYEQNKDYDYPVFNWDDVQLGDVGYTGHRAIYWGQPSTSYKCVEIKYEKELSTGRHLVQVDRMTRRAIGQGLSTPNVNQVGSLTGLTALVNADSVHAVIDGPLKKIRNYRAGETIQLTFDLQCIDSIDVTGYSVMPVLKIVKFPPLPKHPAQLGFGVRKWTDDTGKHKLEAAYDHYQDGQVHLINLDAKKVTLPIKKLSTADQRWVRKQIQKELAAKRKEKRKAASVRSFHTELNQ